MENIRNLVSRGLTEEALNNLRESKKNSSYTLNEIDLLLGKLERINKERREGIISQEYYELEINKVNKATLEICSNGKTPNGHQIKKGALNYKYIIISILVLGFSILWFINHNPYAGASTSKIADRMLEISNEILKKNQRTFLEIFQDSLEYDELKNNSLELFHFQEYRGEISKLQSALQEIHSNAPLGNISKNKTSELLNIIDELQDLLYGSPKETMAYNDDYLERTYNELKEEDLLKFVDEKYHNKFGIIENILNPPISNESYYQDYLRILINSYLNQLRRYNQDIGKLAGYFSVEANE